MNKSLFKHTILLSISNILTLIISMISAMLLARFRSLEEYGTYTQLLTSINIFTSLLLLGLPHSINYFYTLAKNKEEKKEFLNVYYTYSTILSFIIGFTLIMFTPIIASYFNNGIIKKFIYFFAIYPWAKITTISISYILILFDKTTQLVIYKFLNSFCLLFIIIISQTLKLSFNTYIIMLLWVESFFAVWVYILVNKYSGRLNISLNKKFIKRILIFTIPIGLSSIVGTLNVEIDKLVIGRLLSTEQLAIYTNSAREMPVTFLATAITATLLPQLTNLLDKKENKKAVFLWGNSIIISYALICFFAIAFFVFAKDLIIILYSNKYIDGINIFRVYNLFLLLRCTHFGMILSAKGKSKLILYSSLASLGINVILNYILFNILGIIGPAIATFISQLIINLLQLKLTSRVLEVNFRKIFPWNKVFKITLINIFLGGLAYVLKELIGNANYLMSILQSTVLGCGWLLIYWLIIRKDIRECIKNFKKGV